MGGHKLEILIFKQCHLSIAAYSLAAFLFTKSQTKADNYLRLGFGIDDFDGAIKILKDKQVIFSTEPMQTDFGFMAIVLDLDGRKIELYRKDGNENLSFAKR